jgi:Polyketide cyclase / dehydrase and lipid transport.
VPTERAGRRLVVSREIPAAPETVWEILTDTRQWPAWGPSVTDVECTDRYVDAGTTGRVRLPGGVWLPFEVTECEAYRWTWVVARVPATGHRVESTDAGSRVGLELPLYGVAYAPVCRRALGEIARLAGERDGGSEGRFPPED